MDGIKAFVKGVINRMFPAKNVEQALKNRNMYIKYDADKDRAMAANVQRNGTLVQRLCKIS